MNQAERYYPWALLLVGLVLHAWLIVCRPIIFGGDTILRMANREHILLSYQLPGLQAALHYLAKISPGVALARSFTAAVGALAGVGFYLLAAHFMDRRCAFLSGLLFASNPFLLALSTVPYQEILMLAGLFFAFHFYLSGKHGAASACLGIACFTRYEAWAACPVLLIAFLRCTAPFGRGSETPAEPRPEGAVAAVMRTAAEIFKASLLFGWAPLAWMLYRHGVSPAGTFVLETSITPWRFVRYVYLGWITVKNTPIPVLALAGIGMVVIWRERTWKQRGAWLLIAFVSLFLISILFSAHGVSPDPERFVTAREAHLLISAVVLAAGFGLGRLRRVTMPLFALGFGLGLWGAWRFVERESSSPSVQLSYDLARYLDRTLRDGEKVILLVQPIPKPLIDAYFEKSFALGGAAGLEEAQRVMRSLDTSPPDYQRTLVHSRLGKQRLLSFGGMATPDYARAQWIVVWSNFTPGNAVEERIYESVKGKQPVHTLRSGPLSASVYRVEHVSTCNGDTLSPQWLKPLLRAEAHSTTPHHSSRSAI